LSVFPGRFGNGTSWVKDSSLVGQRYGNFN